MNAPTIKSNGLLAREKGQSLAHDVLDTFSSTDCPESQRAWIEEAMFDLVELPRLDSAIPGFVNALMPALAAGHSVAVNIEAAERNKELVELYAHPESARVAYCKKSHRLVAWITDDDLAHIEIPIGPQGLRQLATDLIELANKLEAV